MLRIVSLNCWGGRIYQPLLQFLIDVNADVFCLQEMYSAPPNVPSPLFYSNGRPDRPYENLPVYPSLFEDIRARLPDYDARFYPAAQGYLDDGTTTEHKVQYGIATFVRNDLPIIGERVGFVHDAYRPYAWGEPPLPRNAHSVRLWRYDADKPIVIAHMHGMWQQHGKGDSPQRETQAIAFATQIHSTRHGGDDTVACGDFNVLPNSVTFQALNELSLRDLVVANGYTDTRTSYYPGNPRYADYMLTSLGLQIEKFDILAKPEISDHRPLILDLK